MKVRTMTLAVPFVLGLACTHAGQTGAMSKAPRGEGQASAQEGGASSAGRDPLMQPGPSIQGHAEDQIVVGRIAEATGSSVVIETPQGDKRTLQLVPQTSIELDGQDASSADLAEGQPVHASFDVVEGQEVAVKVRAGDLAGASDAAGQGTGASSPEPGAQPPDAAGQPAPDQGTAPDAGWGAPGSGGTGPSGAQRW